MNRLLRHPKIRNQYLVSVLSTVTVALLCLFTRDFLDYKVTAYLLLVVVSVLAIFLELFPVLVAALVSVLMLDFLFIQPYYTLHINSTEDALLLLMFFIIVMINGVLTFKIRKAEQKAQAKEIRWNTMKLYNALLDSLSHELRTPIATIMGAVGTLQEKSVHLTEDNQAKLLSEMEKASLRLNHQVENLLNMSRLGSGYVQPNPDWCDVNELVYKVLESLREELSQHRVVVKKNEYLPLFRLDYGLTEHIIYNLVFNASQYTPKGAEITIGIDYTPDVSFEFHENEAKAATCTITIADDGKGFPEEEIHKVFDKFYRLQNSKTGGTGLGLSIVKGFTEAQNGKVVLENKEDGGAVFKLLFPVPVMHTKDISNE